MPQQSSVDGHLSTCVRSLANGQVELHAPTVRPLFEADRRDVLERPNLLAQALAENVHVAE